MDTVIYKATEENIKKCAEIIKNGGLVAFPTETVYGLGANALISKSVKDIYAAKGRPSDNPLIVHIADKHTVFEIAKTVPPLALKFMEAFMPGPVTAVLPKKSIVPDVVTGGLDTVAIRMPQNEIARTLISLSGVPVCAPSANTSGKPSPTCANHVYFDLNGKIPAILDGGDCTVGVESTVIDFTAGAPRLLRAGGMPVETIEKVIGPVTVVRNSKVALCPGMKYKHYSPDADVFMAVPGKDIKQRMADAFDKAESDGKKAVIIAMSELKDSFGNRKVWDAGKDCESYAHNLFAFLRKADDEKYSVVICQGVEEKGMGASVYNRLIKAAGGKTI